MYVVSITKSLLLVLLPQLTIGLTGGKILRECLADGQKDSAIICPPEEVISSVEVAFISDPNFGDRQCEPACTPTHYRPPNWCNGEHLCTVDFYDEYCEKGEEANVIRVTYDCSKVFEGCRAHGEQGSFGCPPQHVIKIRSAKVGFISDSDLDDYGCWLTDGDCSWSIYWSRHLVNCDKQQWCHLTPEVYNSTGIDSCRHRQHGRTVIKIIYDCISESEDRTTVSTGVTDTSTVSTTTTDIDAGQALLTDGAAIGIIAGFVLLLLLVIVLVIIIICLYRRMASKNVNNAGNSHDQNAPNAYEMSSSDTRPAPYSTVQLEAGAPAQSRNAPAPAPRFSQRDHTLVDNDFYE